MIQPKGFYKWHRWVFKACKIKGDAEAKEDS